MIYLASPYTHKDQEVVEDRYNKVCHVAGRLLAAGEMVFSPIAHCHHIANLVRLPTDFDWWTDYDKRCIDLCDELWVVMIPGWDESKGVHAEVVYARKTGKPVHHIDPDSMVVV